MSKARITNKRAAARQAAKRGVPGYPWLKEKFTKKRNKAKPHPGKPADQGKGGSDLSSIFSRGWGESYRRERGVVIDLTDD